MPNPFHGQPGRSDPQGQLAHGDPGPVYLRTTGPGRQLGDVVDKLTASGTDVAVYLLDAADDILAFTAFPTEHWPKIRSNNPIESLDARFRRAVPGPRSFPDRAGGDEVSISHCDEPRPDREGPSALDEPLEAGPECFHHRLRRAHNQQWKVTDKHVNQEERLHRYCSTVGLLSMTDLVGLRCCTSSDDTRWCSVSQTAVRKRGAGDEAHHGLDPATAPAGKAIDADAPRRGRRSLERVRPERTSACS